MNLSKVKLKSLKKNYLNTVEINPNEMRDYNLYIDSDTIVSE